MPCADKGKFNGIIKKGQNMNLLISFSIQVQALSNLKKKI